MPEPARKVRVRGRVQAVFFRAWTQAQALELGVRGWVRNADDGSVEAHLEGDEAAMKTLVQRLHEGPPEAQVEHVEVQATDSEGSEGFAIRQ